MKQEKISILVTYIKEETKILLILRPNITAALTTYKKATARKKLLESQTLCLILFLLCSPISPQIYGGYDENKSFTGQPLRKHGKKEFAMLEGSLGHK